MGIGAGFIPGFNSNNLSLLLITYGVISSDLYLAVTAVAVEISYSFFEFMSPMIFGIGNEATGLAVDSNLELTEESFKRRTSIVATGGMTGILISLPILVFADRIYPLFYSALKPLMGWILFFLCTYMIWSESGWKKKLFAAIIFSFSGILGVLVKNGGMVDSDYLLLPIFIGFYRFGSILSKRSEKSEGVENLTFIEKARVTFLGFMASMFGSLIPGMKRGQISAIALQAGNVRKAESVMFILPAISLAFATMSIFILSSTGNVRSTLAFDLQEVMGDIYFSQTLLFIGSLAVAACISVCLLVALGRPIGKLVSRIDRKYFEILGFCVCLLLVINFTGVYGMMVTFTATCISIMSFRFRIRSTHLMGVLLAPSIIVAVMG